MDVVYPLKHGGPHEEARYSLRTLVNLPHDEVWFVGSRPSWARSVQHIPTRQAEPTKYENLCLNIRAACEHPDISDPFVMFNDDFFVMEPLTEIPVLWRETVDDAIKRYSVSMKDWQQHMQQVRDSLGAVRSYELHIPLVVHKDQMLKALELGGPGPCWRTAYGAVAGLEGGPSPDVKVMRLQQPLPAGPFASSSDQSFACGAVGKAIRLRFPEPSRYEG